MLSTPIKKYIYTKPSISTPNDIIHSILAPYSGCKRSRVPLCDHDQHSARLEGKPLTLCRSVHDV